MSDRTAPLDRTHSHNDLVKDTAVTVNSEPGDDGHASASTTDDAAATDPDAQHGVQYMAAVASVWTKTSLITAYVIMWFIYFIVLVQGTTIGTLTSFVTSTWGLLGLTPTVQVVATIINGVTNLTFAKMLDIWGRHIGIVASLILTTIGFIMMAASQNFESYAVADVFWQVGHATLLYTIQIIIADTSSLKSRGLMFAFSGSPNLITIWAAGPIAQAYLDGPGWQWAFGTWAILTPIVVAPLIVLLYWNIGKAKKRGLLPKREHKRSIPRTVLYYLRLFDVVGLLLVTAGLAMFLLPFSIYKLQSAGWQSPLVICLLVFGIIGMILFVVWEAFLAPVKFIAFNYLKDRQVLGSCFLGFTLFLSQRCWNPFFVSFLIINGQTATTATYISNAYQVGSTLFGLLAGAVINWRGRYKYPALFVGLPLTILSLGLTYYFSAPGWHYGYLIFTQILMALGHSFIIICDQVAAMAAVPHGYVAVVLALEGLFSSVGGAIGSSISTAVWNQAFPDALARHLPAKDLGNLTTIAGSLPVQLKYPMGTDTRFAIQSAYGDAQRLLLIPGTAIWIVGMMAVICWRNVDLATVRQVTGNVVGGGSSNRD